MKTIIKNNILGIIIGGIIFGSIGVLAGSYNAKQINFTPSDNTWNVKNVEGAINDLYKEKSTLNFNELYSLIADEPKAFSYTFSQNTKNILVEISSIRCDGCGETDWSISLPDNAIVLNDIFRPEYFRGTLGGMHAATYYIPNAEGTISGNISYRGSIKIMNIK